MPPLGNKEWWTPWWEKPQETGMGKNPLVPFLNPGWFKIPPCVNPVPTFLVGKKVKNSLGLPENFFGFFPEAKISQGK